MPATVVLGAQWGDEGKGKIIDSLAEDADVVVRFQGGANAGHTIVIADKTYPIHLLPSGIFRKNKVNLVGPGVVFDPEVGLKELELAQTFGSQVILDEQTPIVLPLHRLIDAAREQAAGSSAIGTTKRGISPAYSDFWLRRGVTLGDFRSADRLRTALETRRYWVDLFTTVSTLSGEKLERTLGYPFSLFHLDDTIDWLMSFSDQIVPLLGDTRGSVHKALSQDKQVLFEGAQGVMLDAYHGSRPYVTSSLCTAAGVSATYGVYEFDRVVGVAKAYATRVGAGPFPTELHDARGEALRQRGHEFGTTTGRPRRCGWLDLPALRYACRVGGITELVITKIDVLTDVPDLRICDRYRGVRAETTLTCQVLEQAKPVSMRLASWKEDLSACRQYDELPHVVREYIDRIENRTGTPVIGVGVGAERDQMLWRKS